VGTATPSVYEMSVMGLMQTFAASTFLVQNLDVSLEKLPMIYMITGLSSIVAGPVIGRWSDAFGKYRTFVVAPDAP
jgi:predicted MFS family arabinose efflux permease